MEYIYRWTDGTNTDFVNFSTDMEAYYNRLVNGAANRKNFIPYNALADIKDVVIAYDENTPIACASFKKYNDKSAEVKRVWVSPEYRGRHISKELMKLVENRAKEKGFTRTILQTREACYDAVSLYRTIGYRKIDNYPPYDNMELAICFAKDL